MTETRDVRGLLSIALSGSDDVSALRRAGELLETRAGATAKDRFTGPDQRFWDYRVRDVAVTLHWVEGSGLSIVAGDRRPSTERQTRELASVVAPQLA